MTILCINSWNDILFYRKISHKPTEIQYILHFRFVVTELCQGTLESYVNGTYNGPRFQNERNILFQVTNGLAHLHSKRIVHRDIKPTNILVHVPIYRYGPMPQIKLADFGVAKAINSNREDYTNTSATNPNGTEGWMAPEVYQSKRFDSKVDIFPLGCIFAYTLTRGKHPFGDDSIKRISRIKDKEPMILVQEDLNASQYSEEGFKLIEVMLNMEPVNRPTADEVLKSSFFADIMALNRYYTQPPEFGVSN